MKRVSHLYNLDDFKLVLRDKISELILGPSHLSRFSCLDREQLLEGLELCKKHHIDPVLDWDILMDNEQFKKASSLLKTLPIEDFKGIRVFDPGAFYYLAKELKYKNIQLSLEGGPYNLKGILTWIKLARPYLQRVIWPIDLTKDELKAIIPQVNIPCEILVYGSILLGQSVRPLLSPHSSINGINESKAWITAKCDSLESDHFNFPLFENKHGTSIFNPQLYNLLDNLNELEEMGLDYFRQEIENNPFKGFYEKKTSNLNIYNKLKKKDSLYIGEVLEVIKDKYIIIAPKDLSVELGEKIIINTPEGKDHILKIKIIKDTQLRPLTKTISKQLFLTNYIRGVTARSRCFIIQS